MIFVSMKKLIGGHSSMADGELRWAYFELAVSFETDPTRLSVRYPKSISHECTRSID